MVEISLVRQAAEDFLSLDHSVQLEVRKAFEKLKVDPRSYGEPLGNKAGIDLFGFLSIRAGKRIRLIYSIEGDDHVIIRVIGRREAFAAHRTAQGRIAFLASLTRNELITLQNLLTDKDRSP